LSYCGYGTNILKDHGKGKRGKVVFGFLCLRVQVGDFALILINTLRKEEDYE